MKNIALFSLGLLSYVACDTKPANDSEIETSKKLVVFAVNYPLMYFAQRIGEPYIDFIDAIPSDADPAYWFPDQDLERIQKADLILDNGAGYAKWMEKVSLPKSRIANTSKTFSKEYIKLTEGTTHSHGGSGEHVHHGYAFTTWLNFKFSAQQAQAILYKFIEKDPEHERGFKENFNKLHSELLELDSMMAAVATKIPNKVVFASHPVYQYLGKAYGLKIISEHWEPAEEVTEKQWNQFYQNLEYSPAKLMLWEGQPSNSTKTKLLAVKVESVLFSPCGNTPNKGDFITIMKQNITNLNDFSEKL